MPNCQIEYKGQVRLVVSKPWQTVPTAEWQSVQAVGWNAAESHFANRATTTVSRTPAFVSPPSRNDTHFQSVCG
jgi:hypothetical protein